METAVHIVHILPDLGHGGIQNRVLSLIRRLPSFSHVVIYKSAARDALRADFAGLCKLIHCPYPPGRTLNYLLRLAGVLREVKPDVILAHLFGNHTLVSWAAFLAGVPATFGVSANDPIHYSRSRWKPMVLAHAGRLFCLGEIAVSDAVGTILRDRLHLPARRVKVIPNGCEVEKFARRAQAARSRRRGYGAHATILMVAAIGRMRDHPTLLRAVATLRNQGRQVELELAGDVFRESRLVQLTKLTDELGLAGLVRFLGPRHDVPELMGASDIVVHATHTEGLCGAVIEAMAARTPVVATDIPPCREVLDGGRCGLLVPPRDPAALADAIQRVLDDEALRERLLEAAFQRVRENYDAGRMAADYGKLVLQGCSRARSRG